MIVIEDVSYSFSSGQTLSFKNHTFGKGEHWLILGDSGSGKSTLLNILSGLLQPSEGKVMIGTQDLYTLRGNERDKFRAKNMGVIFQKPYFINSLTVEENLYITRDFAGLGNDKERISEILDELSIIDKAKSYPSELSVGQQQRLSIARALLNNPKIIFADEPTSSLDDKNADKVLSLLISQSEKHHAALFIATHDKRVKDTLTHTYLV